MIDFYKEMKRMGEHQKRPTICPRAPRDLFDLVAYNKEKTWKQGSMNLKAKAGR